MEESLFPRGKATPGPTSGPRERQTRPAAHDTLFSERNQSSNDKKTKKLTKRKSTVQDNDPFKGHDSGDMKEILDDRGDGKVDFFHSKGLQEGMLLLGCIREIRELELVVSLPHCNTGYVQANHISETYTGQIRRHLDDDGGELKPLSEMFQIGDMIVCAVLNQTETKKLQLTMQPFIINKYLATADFFIGQMLSGSVKSEEEHGYTIDIGKSSVKAFLPTAEAGCRNVSLGGVVRATVDSIRGDGLILLLSLDEKKIAKSSLKEGQNLSLDALQPGMIGAFKPTRKLKSGLAGKFMGYSASICALNYDMDEVEVSNGDLGGNYRKKARRSKQLKKDDKSDDLLDQTDEKLHASLRGCILFVNPLTKHIALSANLFTLSSMKRHKILDENLSRFPHGHKCEATVSQCLKGLGALMTLEDGAKGFCPTNHISDEKFSDFSVAFGKKKTFLARVMQNVTVDGAMVITLKKSIVESEFYSYENVVPGSKLDCTIKLVQENGLVVTLGKNVFSPVRGFIPKIHMADILLQHPEKRFSKGDLIVCRVLDVDRSAGKIRLTHKRTLVKSKLPVITSYDQLKPNSIVHGYIAAIKQYGVYINLYNNVHGLVPKRQLSAEFLEHPEKTFFVGQVMKCRVLNCDSLAERARFSFVLNPKSKEAALDTHDMITVPVSVEIVQKNEKGFGVLVCDDSKPKQFWNSGVLPTMHLSDFPSLSKCWWDLITPGEILTDCLVASKRRDRLITRKKSIISRSLSADDAHQCLTFSDLHEGLVTYGFIHHIESYGVFVQLPGGLVGLCPKSKMADKFLLTSEGYYQKGQTVVAKVVEIDVEKKRFIVTLKASECMSDDMDSTMEAYLTELNSIMRLLNPSWSESFGVGKTVNVTISGLKNSANEFPCFNPSFPNTYAATVTEMKEIEKGQNFEATLLHIDVGHKKIVLLSDSELKKTISKQGNACKGTVRFLDEDVMSIVTSNKNGNVAALSLARIHPNQPIIDDNMSWKVGDVMDVTMAKSVAGSNIVRASTVASKGKSTTLKRSRQVSECSEASVQGETDFGSLHVGQEVEGAIRSVKHNCLLIRFAESEIEGGYRGHPVTGHLHISELEDDPKQGPIPIKKFQCWSKINCKVIGFRDVKTQHFLAITKRNSTRCVLELSRRKEPIQLQHQNLVVGQEVTAFSMKYILEKDEIAVEVTPSVKGFIPLMLLSEDPSRSMSLMHGFKKPVAWHCVVHKLLHKAVVFAGKGAMVDRNSLKDINEIGANCVLNGKVRKIFQSGVLLSLPDGAVGKVHITNSSDDYSEKAFEKLEIGQIVRCAVLSCTDKKSLVLSLRKSHLMPENDAPKIQDSAFTDSKDLKTGMLIRGFVKSMSSSGIFIVLSPTITGRVSLTKVSKYYIHDTSIVETIFEEGRLVTCKIIGVSQMEGKIDLSLLETDTEVMDLVPEKLGLPLRHGKRHQDKKKEVGLLVDKVEGRKMKKRKLEKKVKENDEVIKKKMKSIEDQDSGLDDVVLEQSPPGYLKIASQADLDEEDPGFFWDASLDSVSKTEADEDSSDEEEEIKESPKKTKKAKESEKAREEAELRRKEEMLLEDRLPLTALDWDKLVLASPQNSLLWVSYMAFHLRSTEVEKARLVAERALKTIDFREEKEKWNVWASLLNLENRFGSDDSLTKCMKRACQHNDPMKVNFHMVSAFEKAGKFDRAEDLCQKMVRKFKQNKTVWMLYITHLVQQGKMDEANEVFKRSLQSLEKKFHLEVISKFGQLEYKSGDPERGRVLFENALSSYPKRADLWSIYLDMLVKSCKIEEAREVFERVVTLTLSTKKMRTFFKKYIDFETKFGNCNNIADIKQKALEYIELKTADADE